MKTVNVRILYWEWHRWLVISYTARDCPLLVMSLQVISIEHPPMWFSKKLIFYVTFLTTPAVLNAGVVRIIRTLDRSENADAFSLQNMMSFHNVDEICRCLCSAQLLLLLSSASDYLPRPRLAAATATHLCQYIFPGNLITDAAWFLHLKGSPLIKQQICSLYFPTVCHRHTCHGLHTPPLTFTRNVSCVFIF